MKLRNLIFSALFVTATFWAGQLGGPGEGPLTTPRPAAASAGHVVTHVVGPGDTLWSIARRVQPEGDVRPLVDGITRMRGSGPLQVGEEITVPLPG